MLDDMEVLKNVNQGTFIYCLQSGKKNVLKNERYGDVRLQDFFVARMHCSTSFNNVSLIL